MLSSFDDETVLAAQEVHGMPTHAGAPGGSGRSPGGGLRRRRGAGRPLEGRGHPARVAILRLLVRREACICGDIDGPRVCYCVQPRTLRRLKALVGSL